MHAQTHTYVYLYMYECIYVHKAFYVCSLLYNATFSQNNEIINLHGFFYFRKLVSVKIYIAI